MPCLPPPPAGITLIGALMGASRNFAFCACPNFASYTFFFKTLSLNIVLGTVFKSVKKYSFLQWMEGSQPLGKRLKLL